MFFFRFSFGFCSYRLHYRQMSHRLESASTHRRKFNRRCFSHTSKGVIGRDCDVVLSLRYGMRYVWSKYPTGLRIRRRNGKLAPHFAYLDPGAPGSRHWRAVSGGMIDVLRSSCRSGRQFRIIRYSVVICHPVFICRGSVLSALNPVVRSVLTDGVIREGDGTSWGPHTRS